MRFALFCVEGSFSASAVQQGIRLALKTQKITIIFLLLFIYYYIGPLMLARLDAFKTMLADSEGVATLAALINARPDLQNTLSIMCPGICALHIFMT